VRAREEAPVRAARPRIVQHLQPLPAVAARLMRLVATDDVVFRQIADLIRTDAAFSAEVLALANSPLLGCRESVRGILQALAMLGVDRVKALVMTVALRNFLRSSLHLPVLRRCWRHSLACAMVCQEIGLACWLDKDQFYTAGLLHDVGRLALMATYPQEYAELLEKADHSEASDFDLLRAEREQFDADHTEVGRRLMEEWGFPAEYLEITGKHHEPAAAGRFDECRAVRLACRLSDSLGFQVAGQAPLLNVEELQSEFPGCSWDRLKSGDDLLLDIAHKINALECSLL
jgi:putative nucleotidyltransferase with HDIG domain